MTDPSPPAAWSCSLPEAIGSAFGVEDLPSNRYGRLFAERYLNRAGASTNIAIQFQKFVDVELGGTPSAPLALLRDFNHIRNLSEDAVIDPFAPDIRTKYGIRHKSSGRPAYDDLWLKEIHDTLKRGPSKTPISRPTTSGPQSAPKP